MFERYTEKARRTIFFARYEASQFGCSCIETEHLVLGVLREGKALANQFLASEAIRQSITQRRTPGLSSTSVDLPLSHESKRALAYAAEESERMNHRHIGTVHLLLGLLREEKSFGAQLLREQGLTLDLVREQAQQSEPRLEQGQSASIAGFDRWLSERETPAGMWTVKCQRVANGTTHFAMYASAPPKESEKGEDVTPVQKLAQIQERIDLIIREMESAIATHEFEKARFYADEERKERENLRLLCEQFNLEESQPRVPLLCIEIVRDDRFSAVQKRCDDYIAEGVAQVWLLHPGLKRAYTVTKTDGFREFKGAILQIANPPLEMDLGKVFD
jgi:Clp amino terminal domain, pathogenicity island component